MDKTFRKIAYSLFTIFLAVSALFFVIRLAPGDPVEKILGPEATMEEILKYREQLGLNLPVVKQYGNYLLGIVKGDLGQSLFKRKDIVDLLVVHLKPTLGLALISISIAFFIGTFIGILSGYYKSKMFDSVARLLSLLSLSFPIFSLAPILVFIFSIQFGILPVSEWGSLKHMVLPVLTLVIPLSAVLIRVTRNKFLEEVSEPWVNVLRAKGLNQFSVLMRVAKVCMPTILNVLAIQLSVVLAGTMITETIFDIPGMGMLLFEGIQNRDYPVVQGVIVYSTIVYMSVYFIVDLLNERIDPRITN